MTLFVAIPGELVTLSKTPLENISAYTLAPVAIADTFQVSNIRSEGSRGDRREKTIFMNLIKTNIGEEDLVIERLSAIQSIHSMNRNYICLPQDTFSIFDSEISNDNIEKLIEDTKYKTIFTHYSRTCNKKTYHTDEENIIDLINNNIYSKKIVISIDVGKSHSEETHKIIQSEIEKTNCHIDVLTITGQRNELEFGDLFDTCKRLLKSIEIIQGETQLISINFSFDFSGALIAREGHVHIDTEQYIATKIPVFEETLNTVTAHFKSKQSFEPIAFAAAGNAKPRQAQRLRLGYPASSLQTIATTFVNINGDDRNTFYVSKNLDLPATWSFKPCIGVYGSSANLLPTKQWSSYASAWLTGKYATIIAKQELPPPNSVPSALSLIGAFCDNISLQDDDGSLPSWLWLFPNGPFAEPTNDHESRTRCFLQYISDETGSEYLLYGSGSYLLTWLELFKPRIKKPTLGDLFLKYLGDLDFIIFTPIKEIDETIREQHSNVIRRALRHKFGIQIEVSKRIQISIHSAKHLPTSSHRHNAQVPVAAIAWTRHGPIDVMGGINHLRENTIGFVPLANVSKWKKNLHFATGRNSPAITILRWINCIAKLNAVAQSCGENHIIGCNQSIEDANRSIKNVDESDQISTFGFYGALKSNEATHIKDEQTHFRTALAEARRLESFVPDNIRPILDQIESKQPN